MQHQIVNHLINERTTKGVNGLLDSGHGSRITRFQGATDGTVMGKPRLAPGARHDRRPVAIGCGPSFRSTRCSRPLMMPARNSTSLVWGAKMHVFCFTGTCINRSIKPCCCRNSPKATSMPCAVFATGQSEEMVVTGDPSADKGTRLEAAVQNYIRFNDLPPDCAKLTLEQIADQLLAYPQ